MGKQSRQMHFCKLDDLSHFRKLDNICFHYLVGGGSRWTTRFIRTVWVRIVVSRIASFSDMVGVVVSSAA